MFIVHVPTTIFYMFNLNRVFILFVFNLLLAFVAWLCGSVSDAYSRNLMRVFSLWLFRFWPNRIRNAKWFLVCVECSPPERLLQRNYIRFTYTRTWPMCKFEPFSRFSLSLSPQFKASGKQSIHFDEIRAPKYHLKKGKHGNFVRDSVLFGSVNANCADQLYGVCWHKVKLLGIRANEEKRLEEMIRTRKRKGKRIKSEMKDPTTNDPLFGKEQRRKLEKILFFILILTGMARRPQTNGWTIAQIINH